jgi:Tfp pilus assembly protein PilN
MVPYRAVIILWLVVIGLAVLFLPLYFLSQNYQQDASRLRAELPRIQATLAALGPVDPQVQGLQSEIEQVQLTASALEQAFASVNPTRVDWPAMLASIGSFDPAQLSLTSLTHMGNHLLLAGKADAESSVEAYARELEKTGLFNRVSIESVRPLVSASPVPTQPGTPEITPTGTPGPGTPSPQPLDEFEMDDFEYRPLILGQSERHNFFPAYDIDKGKFLAKAGRYYRVVTFDLAPGVDTFLTVAVGETTYVNDDRQVGSLASEVVFQVPPGADYEALVTVTNRGQYGPDMWYQLVAEEVVPTPGPAPSDTPPASPSPTPTGTQVLVPTASVTDTPPPTPSPTPTVVPVDAYEPDDDFPPIALAEVQTHTFSPSGDVDRLYFTATAGLRYLVLTANLAEGVDTYLVAGQGEKRWQNDNYDHVHAENLASAVCTEPDDGRVDVAINNLALQYGPDRRYDITVIEAPALQIDPQALDFGTVAQAGGPTIQTIAIDQIEPTAPAESAEQIEFGPVTWRAQSSAPWLRVRPVSGTVPSVAEVSVDPSGLAPGQYGETITFEATSLCASNSPLTVPVLVEVVAPAGAKMPGLLRRLPAPEARQASAYEFVIRLELKGESP